MTGSGTEVDPHIISSADDLDLVNDDLTAWYKLGNDVSANAEFVAIGDETHEFSGNFNGDGYVITVASFKYGGSYAGFFARTSTTAKVRNLGLAIEEMAGYFYVGALVGRNEGIVEACYTTGTLIHAASSVGGLVGENHGSISRCYSTIDLEGTAKAAPPRIVFAGGLVGWNKPGGTISNCYARGEVEGSTEVGEGHDMGGLVGLNQGIISNSYSTGEVISDILPEDDDIGGLVGGDYDSVANSFWDKETSGLETSGGGTGKTTAQMKTASTFTDAGWDLDTIWALFGHCNDGYPCLRAVTPVCFTPFVCPYCEEPFATQEELDAHIASEHIPITVSRAYALSREEL